MKKLLSTLALCGITTFGVAGVAQALVFNTTQVTNTATAGEFTPSINENGDMAWESDGQIYLQLNGQAAVNISNNGDFNLEPQINDAGDVIWRAIDQTTGKNKIYRYTQATGTQLLSNTSNDATMPDMNDNGEAVWVENDGTDGEIIYFNGSTTIAVTNNTFDDTAPQISASGTIVWQGMEAEGDYEIFQYTPANGIAKVNPNNTVDDISPRINDLDEIVWIDRVFGTNGDVNLKTASGSIIQIGTLPVNEHSPVINNAGMVAWLADTSSGNTDIYLYTPTDGTIQVTNSPESDSALAINNIGDLAFQRTNGTITQVYFYDRSAGQEQLISSTYSSDPDINGADSIVFEIDNGSGYDIALATVDRFADADGDGQDIASGDCDDALASVYLGASEVCGDNLDNDCDGVIDNGCTAVCGNGIVEAGEQCDDGNTITGDHCTATCQLPPEIVYQASPITSSDTIKMSISINKRGDMVWAELVDKPGVTPDPYWPPDWNAEIFFYDHANGQIYQLTNNLFYDRAPRLNDLGDVVWMANDGTDDEIFLFRYTNRDANGNPVITQITYGNNYWPDALPMINNNGEIVWEAMLSGKYQVMYYNYNTNDLRQITVNLAYNNIAPKINNNGIIVWTRDYLGEDAEIYIYDFNDDPPHPKPVTANAYDDMDPDINDNGDIVWTARVGADETTYEIFLYDASSGQPLPFNGIRITNDSYRDRYPQLLESGDIVFEKVVGNDPDVYAYQRTTGYTIAITDNSDNEYGTTAADSGDVLWLRELPDPNDENNFFIEVFAYNIFSGASGQVTTSNYESFTPDIAASYDTQSNSWNVVATWGTWDTASNAEQVFFGTPFLNTDNDGDGYTTGQGDCNDNDPAINPGAAEICDGIDQNCNHLIDEGLMVTYWQDSDQDGYGDPAVAAEACDGAPNGFVDSANGADCDDTDATINPGAAEVCEPYGTTHVDNNCDGVIYDPAVGYTDWYYDTDGDGYGDPNDTTNPPITNECSGLPAGYVDGSLGADCDESDPNINPGAVDDTVDGIDQNCDGTDGPVSTTYNLYFPDATAIGDLKNSLGMKNNQTIPSDVLFRGYDPSGNDVTDQAFTNPVTVNPGERYNTASGNICGIDVDCTLHIQSSEPISGKMSTYIKYPDVTYGFFEIYDGIEATTTSYFPFVDENAPWVSTLRITNPSNTTAANISVMLYDDNGTQVGTTYVDTIPALGRLDVSPRTIAGGNFSGSLVLKSDINIAASMIVQNGQDAKAEYGNIKPATILYFPKSYDINGWENTLVVQNTAATPATITVRYFQNDGTEIFRASDGQPDTHVLSQYQRYTVRPSSQTGTQFRGWMMIEADQPVSALLSYRNSTVASTVYPAAQPRTVLAFDKVYDGRNGWLNSLTIHNISTTTDAHINVKVYDNAGTLIASTLQTIAPQAKWNPAPARDFLGGTPIVGTIRMTSDIPVNGLMTYYWKDSTNTIQAFSIYEASSPQ